ncbi:two component transcriptional regulator, LuxR family [Streptomyces sp. DvalAA-14]|uniref:response regulator transcription factor n=1 Tax=unclassified Streptomyces TaxID=2593676 RepID=UPI00081BA5C0|nr:MULTISPECIES: response regulator transcription factor [unclassified Streptomyces]MYS20107.1 response regulator [Streptomyces sp. SID4948]SCD61046.1 two component transcriptional regulator, LuxR family [Streptomyces sp. DvalAA-14]
MPSSPSSRSSSPRPARPVAGIRILLVEDHDMVAEAIRMALDRAADLDVVGRCASIAAGLADTARLRPDVVLLDRRLPDGDGIRAIARLKAAAPGCQVLVLAGEASASAATQVAEAGGSGLILKADNLSELRDAVRRVAAGEMAFSKGLLGAVLDRLTGRTPGRGATLTPRERETLDLLGEGLGSAEISRRLGVALNTARNHIQRVLEKLGARSQLEAVTTARREGLLR